MNRLVAAVIFGVGVPLAVVLAVIWADRSQPVEGGPQKRALRKREPEALPVWEPTSAEDRVIDAFVRLRKTKPAEALELLGRKDKPEMKDRVLTAKEETVLTGELFLRSDALHVLAIWRGEPDDDGQQVPRAGRYTLITRGVGSTPQYRLTTSKPGTSPIQQHFTNPDLIVDVRDGKVFAVRADCHKGPVIERPR